MIGGKAPSLYLTQLKNDPKVQITDAEQDAILQTHLIEPAHLRQNDFDAFYQRRKQQLLDLIERAMGKAAITSAGEVPADDGEEELIGEEVMV